MRNCSLKVLLVILLLVGCKEETDPKFNVASDQVGFLTRNTKNSEIEALYLNDSVVRDTLNLKLGKIREQIRIYERGGAHLLTLTPTDDSLATISNIRIVDPRFRTVEGIHVLSTYKDIEAVYPIKKIVPALNNIVLFLKGTDIYFTIEKAQLPENLRYSTSTIEAVQIPDAAKIKYMMVGWD